jgi:hypothetical protein
VYLRSQGRLVSVKLRNLAVRCEDGTTLVFDFKVRAKVRKDGSFRRQNLDNYGLGQYFAQVAGQVSTQKVEGTFYYLNDSYQPEQRPDCTTPGPQAWKATTAP